MKSLSDRIADRKAREEERLKSGKAYDAQPSNHAAEALDPVTNAPQGDGLGKLASTGANGALGNPAEPEPQASPGWPAAPAPVAAKAEAGKAAPKKDPNA